MWWLQGFKKVDPDRWEFASEGFLRGQRDLLRTIKRRRAHQHPSAAAVRQVAARPILEVGQFGFDGEIERLKRDKQALFEEVAKLRQEQQSTRAHIAAMEERVISAEHKQHQMMAFLARAMQNPGVIHQLIEQREMRKELEDAISKKRRRQIEGSSHQDAQTSGPDVEGVALQFGSNAEATGDDAVEDFINREVEERSEARDEDLSKFWWDMLNLEPSDMIPSDKEYDLDVLCHDTDDPPPMSPS